LRVKLCKYCVLTPKKALPCMNTRLLVYRMSKSVQQPISARSVEIFCVQARKKQRNREKIGWDWLYGEKYPLVRSWRNVGRYGGRNHVCNIWWLSVKGCGFGKGLILPSPIDLRYRPYNTINACFPRLHNWQDVHAALQQSSSGHTLLMSRYAKTLQVTPVDVKVRQNLTIATNQSSPLCARCFHWPLKFICHLEN